MLDCIELKSSCKSLKLGKKWLKIYPQYKRSPVHKMNYLANIFKIFYNIFAMQNALTGDRENFDNVGHNNRDEKYMILLYYPQTIAYLMTR